MSTPEKTTLILLDMTMNAFWETPSGEECIAKARKVADNQDLDALLGLSYVAFFDLMRFSGSLPAIQKESQLLQRAIDADPEGKKYDVQYSYRLLDAQHALENANNMQQVQDLVRCMRSALEALVSIATNLYIDQIGDDARAMKADQNFARHAAFCDAWPSPISINARYTMHRALAAITLSDLAIHTATTTQDAHDMQAKRYLLRYALDTLEIYIIDMKQSKPPPFLPL